MSTPAQRRALGCPDMPANAERSCPAGVTCGNYEACLARKRASYQAERAAPYVRAVLALDPRDLGGWKV